MLRRFFQRGSNRRVTAFSRQPSKIRSRLLACEPLETRALLSVAPGIDDDLVPRSVPPALEGQDEGWVAGWRDQVTSDLESLGSGDVQPGPGPGTVAPPPVTVVDNGPSLNRVDIIFLGDGYTLSEINTTYVTHINAMLNHMFNEGENPFPRYENFFNVHRINVVSNQSGADNPGTNTYRDTALDASYWWDGVTERLLYVSTSKVMDRLNAELTDPDLDPEIILVTVNDTKYGGGGGTFGVYAGGHPAAPEVALHEMGHSFSNLADEYDYGGPAQYPYSEPSEVNVTTDPTGQKWARWLGYNDPTDNPDIGPVGVFEGADYSEFGVYRPTITSKMEALDQPFNAVSREKIILDIYDYVDPLDTWLDNSSPLTGDPTLTVDTVDPNVIKVQWSVNGTVVSGATGESFRLTDHGFGSGTYTVTARAYDDTPWVRTSLSKLEQSVTWNVTLVRHEIDLVAASDTGALSDDNVTNRDNSSLAKALQFSVSNTSAGATVRVYAGGTLVGSQVATGTTTTVTTNGTIDLADGVRQFTATIEQAGQPESPNSSALAVTIDTVAPTVTAPDLLAGSDTGASQTDSITQGNTPGFDGTASDSLSGMWKVEVQTDDGKQGADTLAPFYSVSLATPAEGTRQVTATAYDIAGNTSSAVATVYVDRTSPQVTLAVPASTYDLTPDVSVTVADANLGSGAAVRLDVDLNNDGDFADLQETGYASATLSGTSATFTVRPALAVGTYRLRARVTDLAGNEGTSAAMPMAVTDPPVVIRHTDGSTDVVESVNPMMPGVSDFYEILLSRQPTANVVVTIVADAQVAVTPSSVTFTPSDWSSPRAIFVTAIDDFVDEGSPHAAMITHQVTSGDAYFNNSEAAEVIVNITDDDTAGIILTPLGMLQTSEDGSQSVTISVVLATEPTAAVTVAVASSNAAEGTVSPASLTFQPWEWNMPKTLVVAGVNDFVDDGDVNYLVVTSPANSQDPNYQGLDAEDLALVNLDDDVAGITLTQLGIVTTEAGGTATFTVQLDSQPTADVTLSVQSLDTSEGVVSPASMTFTSANWNTPKTVTVTGVNDNVDDGDVLYTVRVNVTATTDFNYSGKNGQLDLYNVDDDTAGLIVTPATLVTKEQGTTSASFFVRLGSQPTANVTLAVVSQNTAEGTVAPAQLSFTTTDWNVPKQVTVTAVDDLEDDGDVVYAIDVSVAGTTDPAYLGADPASVQVTNADNDEPGITVLPLTGLLTSETGGKAQFSVQLDLAPKADVVIYLTSSNKGEGVVSPNRLVFTPANWSTPQIATVTGVDDPFDDGNTTYLFRTEPAISRDLKYHGLDGMDYELSNRDNDVARILIDPLVPLYTSEAGAAAVFRVRLDARPTGNVAIPLASSDPTEGKVSTSLLWFTSANWNVPQTVLVTGINDQMDDDNSPYWVVTAPASSSDPAYHGLDGADLAVFNQDDDTAGIVLLQTGGSTQVTEGSLDDRYSVVLTTQPRSEVMVTITTGDQVAVGADALVFTPHDWNVPQTVIVSAVDDEVIEGPATALITHQVISDDPAFEYLALPDVAVAVHDNDAPALTSDFVEMSGIPLVDGQRFILRTVRSGWLSVGAAFQNSQGNIDLTLLTDTNRLVGRSATQANQERIDALVEANQTYTVVITGNNPNATLRFGNQVSRQGNSWQIFGTSREDAFQFDAASGGFTINGFNYQLAAGQASTLLFDGGGGEDTAVMRGSLGNDVANLRPGSGTFSGPGFNLTVRNVAAVTAHAGTGNDVAHLVDSAGDDWLVGRPDETTLSGTWYSQRAVGFDTVYAYSSTGRDSAEMYDGPGRDTFVGKSTYSSMSGPGYQVVARQFDAVAAYATPGTRDLASLADSRGNDVLTATPDTARFTGSSFDYSVNFFDAVHVDGRQGGRDTATLHDGPENDGFVATPTVAALSGAGFAYRVTNFEEVTVRGNGGGDNSARLYGSAGSDTLDAGPASARYYGPGYDYRVQHFRVVNAFASAGGNDVAFLHDSQGDDLLTGVPEYAALSGPGYTLYARGFSAVTADASTGRDVARLTGSSGADLFTSRSDQATLQGSGYSHTAKAFDEVYAQAGAGGLDEAYLEDSAGDDWLWAGGPMVRLSYPDRFAQASDFSLVAAIGTTGRNTKTIAPEVDYLVLLGAWE